MRNVAFYQGTKPPNFRMFTFWVEHNLCGMSYGEIVERHGVSYRAVASAVQRAAGWLPERWDQFVNFARSRPGGGVGGNVHRLLADLKIEEVVQIAQGKHPMSDSVDDAELMEWANSKRVPVELWRVGPHANTPLANLLAERVNNRFPGKKVAARAIGINLNTLNVILFGEGLSKLSGRTPTGLSAFLGKSAPELEAMLRSPRKRVSKPAPTDDVRIRELEAELAQLRGASSGGG